VKKATSSTAEVNRKLERKIRGNEVNGRQGGEGGALAYMKNAVRGLSPIARGE